MSQSLLTAMLPLLDDLSRDLPQAERYQRLLQTLQRCLQCEALALLRLDEDKLVPVAPCNYHGGPGLELRYGNI